jgi:hypothetical protein
LALHVQLLVFGPVLAQVAFGSQPPWLTRQELTWAQVNPLPVYPTLHAQVLVPGPVRLQVALGSHPPLETRHESIGAHVMPLPE